MLSIRRIGTVLSTAILIGLCAAIASTSQASAATDASVPSGKSLVKFQSSASGEYFFLTNSTGQYHKLSATELKTYKSSLSKAKYQSFGFYKQSGTSKVYLVSKCTTGYTPSYVTASEYKIYGPPTSQAGSLAIKSSLCYSSPLKVAYITNN